MMTTIPVPTYLLDIGQLEEIREQAYAFIAIEGECERALACIKALNAEIVARGHTPAVADQWNPCPAPRAGWPVKLRLVP